MRGFHAHFPIFLPNKSVVSSGSVCISNCSRQSRSGSSLSKPLSAMFYIIEGNLQGNLPPTYNEKSLDAKKAELTVKRITFERSEAKPSDMVYVSVPKLNKNEVIVPGSLALFFKIDLTGGHANNFLVHNVSWALMDKFTVKFAGTTLQDIVVATPTRSLKTFCSQLKTVTACCWRESKAKNFVTFARTLVTKRQLRGSDFGFQQLVLHLAGAPNSGRSRR